MNPGPDAVIAWVRSRGSDAEDLRDAAHEASHALQVRPRRWDRESIHTKVMRRGKRFAGTSELEARAVERLVCEAHGVEYNWAHWEMIALMEAGKNGVWLPTNLGLHIARLMASPSVVARAKMILRCGEQQDSRKDGT